MLQCCYCSKQFKYDSEKKRHEKSHVPQFECKECLKKFSFVSALKRHEKQHARTGSVQCEDCGHNFRDEILLKRHIKYAHKGTYICSKCDAIFNSDLALKSHIKTHKPRSERRFQCSTKGCDKSFNFPHHLKHHELTHTNTKQHHCNICGKGFIQSHHLKSHLRTHERDRKLACPEEDCNKKFDSNSTRKRHLATHTSRKTFDSGVSSDSNCDIPQDLITDTKQCATCGQKVCIALYEEHKAKCEPSKEEPEDLSLNIKDEIETHNNDIEIFSNCKSVLGKCIATEDSSCLCAQIKDANNFYDSMLPNYNFEPTKFKNEIKSDQNLLDQANYMNEKSNIEEIKLDKLSINQPITNMCGGCDCSKNNSTKSDIAIERATDGAIKIKDTFDFDYSLKKGDLSDTPYRCKTLFGKCIVSGNGTISEGCLCAKIADGLDEQIVTQEIEDIMPQPCMSY